MDLTIERVTTKQQLRQLVRFPWTIYGDDPQWVPPLFFERLQFLNRRDNPFFAHAEVDFFLARRDGRLVGTIAAIHDERHNLFHKSATAHFGLFEVENDQEAATLLLNTVVKWGRARELIQLIGPMNLSTNHECGLLISGFESPPALLMSYNPPYYAELLQNAGFHETQKLVAWKRDINDLLHKTMPERLVGIVQKVKERYNLRIRPVNMAKWDEEVAAAMHVYNNAWQDNWGFVPLTEEEIRRIARDLKPILDPNLIFVVEKDNEAVGFAVSLPDINQKIHQLQPSPSYFSSYLNGLRALRGPKPDTFIVYVLGVKEKYRVQGIDALLYYETARAADKQGYKWGVSSWILADNAAMNRPIEAFGGHIYKEYMLYEKTITP